MRGELRVRSSSLEGKIAMRAILLASVALTFAACSPPASNTNSNSGQSAQTPPAATASSPAAGAQIRLGRWSKVMTVMGQRTTDVECVTNADLNQLAREPNSRCTSANGFQSTAEGMVYEAQCTGEDGGGHIRTVVNGDMQNHYVVDMTTTAANMPSPMQIHIEGTYEGACRGDE